MHAAAALIALLLAGCAAAPPPVARVQIPAPSPAPIAPAPEPAARLVLVPARFVDLPGWNADRVEEVLPAFMRTCARLARLADTQTVGPDALGGQVADWRAACAVLL